MEPDWASLPKHLLDSVLMRLVSPSDFLLFSLICKRWFSVAKDNQIQRSKVTAPMLLISTNKESSWNIYSVVDSKVYDLQLSVPNKRYCGGSFGWLVTVEKDFTVTLINPFLRVKGKRMKENSIIRLPQMRPPSDERFRQRWSRDSEYYAFRAVLSADPISNAEDCIVVVIYGDVYQMAFIRLNGDTTWTYIDTGDGIKGALIDEVVHIEDKFYATDGFNQLLSFRPLTHESTPDLELVTQQISSDIFEFGKYLVYTHEKEFLMVIKYSAHQGRKRETTGFKVYELKLDKLELVEKHELGDDVALFIGDNSSISVPASKSGCLSNCIYFNHDYDGHYHYCRRDHSDFGVYNVRCGSFSQPYTLHAQTLVEMTDHPPIWVVPTLNL